MNALARLRAATGLNLSHEAVERAVRARMAATGNADRERYTAALDAAELAALVELVVVPESWLFRDPQAFAVAATYAQRRLARGGRQLLRMLSVPCAGGEEPYSLAMALADAGVPPAAFAIDGVDLSTACIARAEEGLYGRNAFRGKDLSFRERHFTPAGDDLYRIDPALCRRVRFRQGNLLTSELAPPGSFDVIFCRNLLIYFDGPTTAAAIARLATLLADDGVLLAGYAEVPAFTRNGFTALPYRQAFALRKAGAPPDGPYDGLPLPVGDVAPAVRRRVAAARPAPPPPPSPAPPPPAAAPRPRAVPSASVPAAAPAVAPMAAPVAAPAPAGTLDDARRLADGGRPTEAQAICRDLLARQPENAEAWFLLGLLAGDGAPDQAETALRRCIYLAPDHYDALCHLALLAGRRGDAGGQASLQARAARVWRRRHSDRARS
ncbi:chemotaxis protein methyltransferase WspC [Pseudoduganella flava]|uniref:Chemotaxis protein methyltransferase WspC n=1 Tax=Pseudoduganella flava TaxID=871742 RepID=A0A562PIL8_9BURK|nr:protein-glutamate O-methyltransferase CheR [Pseudoduganella flava]QGZ41880.1 methyltransferase domain-containing protein [Pseudoduganella flava]TWI44284.1 chemotaxis protein methyltransferase WspC [Pseudoduganella flava]